MPNDDLLSGLGAAISGTLAFLSWLWNVSFLQLLFTFVAGSLTTYFVQARLQDRAERREHTRSDFELMREKVYGPLFKILNVAKEEFVMSSTQQEPRRTWSDDLEDLRKEHLYFMIDADQKTVIDNFSKATRRYKVLDDATLALAHQLSIKTVSENLPKRHPQASLGVDYALRVGGQDIKRIDLASALSQNSTPLDILKEEADPLKAVEIKVSVGGFYYEPEEDVNSACAVALQWLREEAIFQDRESERNRLMKEADKIISDMKLYIIAKTEKTTKQDNASGNAK